MNYAPAKISVIVPMFNAEKYLDACLTSCIQQTLYDIEIICVNDGSKDNTVKIVEAFMAKDLRIQLVNKKNGGLSSARNDGMKVATGQILIFLDSDDYLSTNACERVWLEYLEYFSDIITFGTAIFPRYPKAEEWYYWRLSVDFTRYNKFTPSVLFSNRNSFPFVWRQAYKKEFLDKYDLKFDESVKYGEDTVFQFEAFPHASRFSYLSDELYHYRWGRKGSMMDAFSERLDEKIELHIDFVSKITDYWRKQGWLDLYGKAYLHWLLHFLLDEIALGNVKDPDRLYASVARMLRQQDLLRKMSLLPINDVKLIRMVKKYDRIDC